MKVEHASERNVDANWDAPSLSFCTIFLLVSFPHRRISVPAAQE